MQSVLLVGKAAFVDDETRVDRTVGDGAQDAIVAELHGGAEGWRGQPQQAESGGVAPGDRHPPRDGLRQGHGGTRHHEWTHAMAKGGAASKQPIAAAHAGKGAHTQLGEMKCAVVRAPVEFLDIQQHRPDGKGCFHQPVCERMEGEGIVGAGGVAEGEFGAGIRHRRLRQLPKPPLPPAREPTAVSPP